MARVAAEAEVMRIAVKKAINLGESMWRWSNSALALPSGPRLSFPWQ